MVILTEYTVLIGFEVVAFVFVIVLVVVFGDGNVFFSAVVILVGLTVAVVDCSLVGIYFGSLVV